MDEERQDACELEEGPKMIFKACAGEDIEPTCELGRPLAKRRREDVVQGEAEAPRNKRSKHTSLADVADSARNSLEVCDEDCEKSQGRTLSIVRHHEGNEDEVAETEGVVES